MAENSQDNLTLQIFTNLQAWMSHTKGATIVPASGIRVCGPFLSENNNYVAEGISLPFNYIAEGISLPFNYISEGISLPFNYIAEGISLPFNYIAEGISLPFNYIAEGISLPFNYIAEGISLPFNYIAEGISLPFLELTHWLFNQTPRRNYLTCGNQRYKFQFLVVF